MYQRILAPVDGSAASNNSLNEALRLAKDSGARLCVLHVIDGIAFRGEKNPFTATADSYRESGRKLMAALAARTRKLGVAAEFLTEENLSGRAADSIVGVARKWRADLIVMGTHGRRGFSRLILGSDADLVLRTATVPVLFVRPGPGRSAPAGRRKKATKTRAPAKK